MCSLGILIIVSYFKDQGKSDLTSSNADSILLILEECEYEKRRSHERFSKPLTLKKKTHKGKKPKLRCCLPPKPPKFKPELPPEESCLHVEETQERSPSPVRQPSPDLDLSTLHEQVDCSEPLLSCASQQIDEDTETMPGLSVATNRLLSSPRNSIIATHRIYLDPDIQQISSTLGGETNQNPLETKLAKLNVQINGVKKKIKKYEFEFESKHGYKVSHADKLNEKNIRNLYAELNKMKKEQKQMMELSSGRPRLKDVEMPSPSKNLQDTLKEIEKVSGFSIVRNNLLISL